MGPGAEDSLAGRVGLGGSEDGDAESVHESGQRHCQPCGTPRSVGDGERGAGYSGDGGRVCRSAYGRGECEGGLAGVPGEEGAEMGAFEI